MTEEFEAEGLFPEEEAAPAAAPTPEEPERTPEPSEKSWGRGMVSGIAAVLAYVVIPLALIQFLPRVQVLLTLPPGADLAILLVGPLAVVTAFYAGYTSRNIKLCSIARLCETGLTALYLFLVLGRGPVIVALGAAIFTLDITGYFLLVLAGTLLHGLSPAWDLVQYSRGQLG